jgi:prepilin-type N-terminal cleavage/methylation domain-containing protein
MEFAQRQDAMARHASSLTRRERGFSVIELLIVVAIVLVMAAVAFPNIGKYIRNYKIKGAAQMVAGELHAARSRAIMSNANLGVSFVIVDQDSFRFVQEDIEAASPERLSSLKNLPSGIVFVPTTLNDPGPTLRFLRLGGFCNPAASSSTTCRPAVPEGERMTSSEIREIDTGTVNGSYIGALPTGTMEIRIRETTTGLERTIQIAPGGRVLPQP